MEPAALLFGVGEHVPDRLPEPQRPVPDRQHRCGHPPAATRAQQIGPGLAGLPEPIGQGDELFAAVGADPDYHQQAHLVLGEAHLEVDTVHPHIDVVGAGQRPRAERGRFLLPLGSEPGDRRRRQARTAAQKLRQRRSEIRGREPMQVQQRQHLRDTRRLA